jgi:hypothetical protein
MAYKIPTFILAVNIWRAATGTVNPPDVTALGNLAWGRRVTAAVGIPEDLDPDTMISTLLLPKGTDVRDSYSPGGADVIECPAGSHRYYGVKQVDDVGKGFANEFRIAIVYKLAPWPAPIP